MGKILLKGGRVIDPVNSFDEIADILVEDGLIAEVKAGIKAADAEVIDCTGKIVSPGFIDMHVHLREPGGEESETIETGTASAAAGGFTAVACMPNTSPCIDNAAVVEFIKEKAERHGSVKVFPVGAVTKGRKGEELAEIGEMFEAGAPAFSDDGDCIMNSKVMRRAMEYTSTFGATIIQHAEDHSLSKSGTANEGMLTAKIGLYPMPTVSEEIMTRRDIALAEYLDLPVHIAHISAASAVAAVRSAKARGIKVTCEVTPHHFTLNEEEVLSFNTNAKMSPPLRAKEDVEACIEGLRDGTIDCIATDHAPHHIDKKKCEFDIASFGIVGLETAVGLTITELVEKGVIDLKRMVELLSVNPARILNLDLGHLSKGAIADITIIDHAKEWEVDPSKFKSKSRNTPFAGFKLKGAPVGVIVDGKKRF